MEAQTILAEAAQRLGVTYEQARLCAAKALADLYGYRYDDTFTRADDILARLSNLLAADIADLEVRMAFYLRNLVVTGYTHVLRGICGQ